jgi:hypothetical protein
MEYRLKHLTASLLMLTALTTASAQSHTGEPSKVFAPVDASQHQRLSERLKLYVEYERTHQWGKLYELTSKWYLEKETRDEFVKRRASFSGDGFSDTLDFVPHYTVNSYIGMEGNYSIYGCMKVLWKGRIHYWQAGVDAFWENGDWYFSSVSAITGIDAPPRPCLKPKGK